MRFRVYEVGGFTLLMEDILHAPKYSGSCEIHRLRDAKWCKRVQGLGFRVKGTASTVGIKSWRISLELSGALNL